MPGTTVRGFRHPLLDRSETADVPRDIKNLADDIDAQYLAVATVGSLPAFGKPGRRIFVTGDNSIYLDTGTAWVKDGGVRPWRQGITWAIAGEVRIASGDNDYIPPTIVPIIAGQTAKLVAVRFRVNNGPTHGITFRMQKNGADIVGWTGIVSGSGWGTHDPADVALADGDSLQPVVTTQTGTPKNASIVAYLEHTS